MGKTWNDGLLRQAATLAFVTVLSLIPLLAAFAELGTRMFTDSRERWVELLARVLPYSEDTILHQLQIFLDQAGAVRGIGSALFLVSALGVFSAVEEAVNHIWQVPQGRPLRSRLVSLTLVLFWGSVVVGAFYSVLFMVQERAWFPASGRLLDDLLSFLLTLTGLTALYWLVPHTRVRFSSALAGALVAALLLGGLRLGFGLYVQSFRQLSVIYGSFGLAFLFMISLHLGWLLVLLGCEVAYCVQNLAALSTARGKASNRAGPWLALSALSLVARGFQRGEPITTGTQLAADLGLPSTELQGLLEPMVDSGILARAEQVEPSAAKPSLLRRPSASPVPNEDMQQAKGPEPGEGGYLLATDPHTLLVRDALAPYDQLDLESFSGLPVDLAPALRQLQGHLAAVRDQHLDQITLAQLMGTSPAPDPHSGSEEKQGETSTPTGPDAQLP